MEIKDLLFLTEGIISVLLIVSILLQQREGGLGNMFGGGGGGESYRTKRGFELFMMNATIVLVVLFIVNSLAIAYLAGR
jgi:protein translocase SecG subunit